LGELQSHLGLTGGKEKILFPIDRRLEFGQSVGNVQLNITSLNFISHVDMPRQFLKMWKG